MRDPYFGNRDWFTGEKTDTPEVWTDWDYALVSAYQIIQDHTDSNGLLTWESENERMEVWAIKKHDKFKAAVDLRTKGSAKRPYKADPGEYFVPKLNLRGGEWPTFSEWVKSQVEDD